jgi:hypothetical protein
VESTPLALTECVLDPELMDFCTHLHITPAVRKYNENNSDISNCSSDIEDKVALKKFTHTLQKAQIVALKKENRKKREIYTKKSKNTLRHCKNDCIKLASKGFLPVNKFMRIKGVSVKGNKLTMESDTSDKEISLVKGNVIKDIQDSLEAFFDEAMALDHDACVDSNVNSALKEESEGSLPDTLHNLWHYLTHDICMESEESNGNGDGNTDGDTNSNGNGTRSCLDDLRCEVILAHERSQGIPESTIQLLCNHFKLQEASARLTKMKKGVLNVIVQAHVTVIIGLLNVYTDKNLKYTWRGMLEVITRMQECGTNQS